MSFSYEPSQFVEEYLAVKGNGPYSPSVDNDYDTFLEGHPKPKEKDPEPIYKEWLKTRNNWPKHLEAALRKFMHANKFYNYKKTDHHCERHLKNVVKELRSHFDPNGWNKEHDEDLKEKILKKIHRIRTEVELKADPVEAVLCRIDRLSPEQCRAVFKEFVKRLGPSEARSILDSGH